MSGVFAWPLIFGGDIVRIYIANAFSLQMIQSAAAKIAVSKVTAEYVKEYLYGRWAEVVSAIGHADTARVVAGLLESDRVTANRINVALQPNDLLVVAQVTGGRLPEGATELPEGVSLQFYFVRLEME